jgi:Fe-S cluster assembly protein SufB|uniref:ABC transporter n=2 Tax=Emiliania huxleyi TaxID=2903 RepID=Q4G3E3_EMIHU|nr:putative ABC transporter [Gephyrocapsa oceanica]YP_010393599.1 putative ABC transporter [Gephyrocapsa ericsonii]YP_277324.1 putative ABC transporter [Emiliania huxleyi]UPY84698.1 putative ABC transporter [Gephyrocapsa parvula]AAX13823.1 ABC transporter [Emiliania huxleyi]AEI29488.1 putative ABC transporter [Emiliania huxleyi]UPY81891.1 putative ABC transporter [Emiliania huxleyi]UPY82388.1 putative ABC transporter [Emiliania huxleyi]
MEKQTNDSEKVLEEIVVTPYKYGFKTEIENENFPKGLNQEIVDQISRKKDEPLFMSQFRAQAFSQWQKMPSPDWAYLGIPPIDYQNIQYYSVPKTKKKLGSLDEVDPELLKTFDKLGVSLNEQKRLTNVAVDAVFDSVSIGSTFKVELQRAGVIFCSFAEAVERYPELIKKYLGSVVPIGDNFFAALNSAVFSDGSFCYVPKDVKCPMELSTYFRINNEEAGQFERTLIVVEDRGEVGYLEGCTAPQFSTNQLHAAVVELIAFEEAVIKYSTVQNWYAGDENGIGGVYNFVTKRGLCSGRKARIAWTQVETGSAITWKYPSCILAGDSSIGEFYSVALTTNKQEADTGTKMIHLGSNSKSRIISKGISTGNSKNSYRGLVKVSPRAINTQNYSQCDSLLIGKDSSANTFPYLEIQNSETKIEHEASTSKIAEEQLFYLLQRGISMEEAVALMVNGFCKEVFNELPFEFASEADRLLNLKLEGSVG